jgi:hypothetical protein
MTLIQLVKSTTSKQVTHLYELKIHGSDGLIRTKTINIRQSDSMYGKLRMSGNRFAVRDNNWGPYKFVTEEAYQDLLRSWSTR